jgi:CRISPR system Cascade subunit CasD
MSTLLIRLSGPMQSWGTQSRFTRRDTGPEPSKSGVIGLLCAALGRPRDEPLRDLAALRMGVRVDREGRLEVDYQTAGGTHLQGDRYGVVRADGSPGGTVVSVRYYLAGADFLVGLEGDRYLLERLDRALARPVWQLFLGRKGYVPGCPVRLPDEPPLGPGLRDEGLEAALRSYPWPEDGGDRLRFVFDAEEGGTGEVRADVPISFAPSARQFATRYVRTEFFPRPLTTSPAHEEVAR